MPYALLHNPDGSVRVENVDTGRVYAKHTTAKRAEKQIRLLRAVEHGTLKKLTGGRNKK